MRSLLLSLLLVMTSAFMYAQPLSGTYTINPSGGDYTSFSAAVTDLNLNGVSDDVTFEVASGTYNEQIEINLFSGASAANEVVFESASGNPEDVVLQYAATTENDNYVVRFDQAQFVEFTEVTIKATGASYARAVVLNGVTNITLLKCVIEGANINNSQDDFSVIYAPGNMTDVNVLIKQNEIKEGSYGIDMENVGPHRTGVEVAGNTITGFYRYGMYLRGCNEILIEGNTLDPMNNSTAYGIYHTDGVGAATITGNIITNTFGYGIYLSNIDASLLLQSLVANNMVQNDNNNGIYINGCEYMQVVYNSVATYGTQAAGRITYGTEITVQNNIFANFNRSYAFEYTGGGIVAMDYNDLYTGGCRFAYRNGIVYSLAEWQNLTGFDNNSLNKNPQFAGKTDLHTDYYYLASAGTDLSGLVTEDIDEETRATPPCIGADEYTATPVAPLAGAYTIPGDFASLAAAQASLKANGISDNVIFNIQAGTYTEQLVLSEIDGLDAQDSIIFQSATNNAADVSLVFTASNEGENGVIRLNNVSNVTFKNLTLTALGTTYGSVVRLDNTIKNVNFYNCVFQANATGSSSDDVAVVWGQDIFAENLKFVADTFLNGSNGLYLRTWSQCASSHGLVIKDNIFQNNYDHSIYLDEFEAAVIEGNLLASPANTGAYGMYAVDLFDLKQIANNTIKGYGNYSMYLNNVEKGTNEGLVTNNVIVSAKSGSRGLYLNSCDDLGIYHNSISTFGGSATMRLSYNSGLKVNNNIIANFGERYAVELTGGGIDSMDYNNLYSNGCRFAYVSGIIYSMEEWQQTTGFDQHSLSLDPRFVDNQANLHTTYHMMADTGIDLSGVVDSDIEGSMRDSKPCLGAYEFAPEDAPFIATNISIPGDYPTLAQAIDSVNRRGISGNVRIELEAQVYNEQFLLRDFLKANPADSLIITTKAGANGKAILQYSATQAANNYVARLNRVTNVVFQNIRFEAMGNDFGRAVMVDGWMYNVGFENCEFYSNVPNSASDNEFAGIYAYQVGARNIDVVNCQFEGPAYGIRLEVDNNCETIENVNVVGNRFKNITYYGVRLSDLTNFTFEENIIDNTSGNNTLTGVYVNIAEGNISIRRNEFIAISSRGLYLNSVDQTDPANSLGMVVNNMISCDGNTQAIYANSCNDLAFYHNSLNVYGTSGQAMRVAYGGDLYLKNNIMAFMGGGTNGYAFEYNGNGIVEMDYNNLYSTSSRLVYRSGIINDLATWQSTSGFDQHSLSVDPGFSSNMDLHLASGALNDKGTDVGVTIDMDGNPREMPPYIGADEVFDDLQVVQVSLPDTGCLRSEEIIATIENAGDKPAVNFDVTYRINGTIPISTMITDTLHPKETTDVSFANQFDFTSAATYLLEVWVSYPDDQLASNDTLTKEVVSLEKPSAAFNVEVGCEQDSSLFTDQSNHSEGIASQQWYEGTVSNMVGAGSDINIYFATQTQTIGLVVTANNGCTDTTDQQVNAHPKPSIMFSAADGCVGEAVAFDNQSQISSGTIDIHQWDFDDGETSLNESPDHVFTSSGFFNVKLKGTSDKGCVDSITNQVQIFTNPEANFTFDDPVCKGTVVTFDDQSSISTGSITMLSWAFGDGNSASGSQVENTYMTDGSFEVALIATSDNGCADTATKSVMVEPAPEANFTGDMVGCETDSFFFEDQSTISSGSIASIDWDFGDGGSAMGSQVVHIYQSEGSYDLILTATSQTGCTGDTTMPVSVFGKPPKPVIQQKGDTLYTTVDGTYQWYLEGVLISGANDSFYVATQPGEYVVEVAYIECSSFSDPFVISGMADQEGSISGQLFPNPANATINIQLDAREPVNGALFIYSMDGRLLKKVATISDEQHYQQAISIGEMTAGSYYIVLKDEMGGLLKVWPFQKM